METIWDIQTNVSEWPSWQPEVDGAQVGGPLAVGSVFRWQTGGLPVSANVEAMQGALDGSLRNWLENLKRTAEDSARFASRQ